MGLFCLLLSAGWVQTPLTLERADAEIARVVERARPAVVTVQVRRANMPARPLQSSGFIIDSAGYIVGSADGVQNARELQVLLPSGEVYSARLVGSDAITGIALLKIDPPRPLPALRFGNSDNVLVGTTAVLIGNRGGLEGSVTVGTIGGKDRVGVRPQSQRVVPVLQFNGTVGAGEPGAPLLNTRGEVIGVIIGALSSVEGLPAMPSTGMRAAFAVTGFAVPSKVAQRVVDQLRTKGRAEHPWLGVDYRSLLGGAQVMAVVPNGPAARAGIVQGDVIVGYDGQHIDSAAALTRALYNSRPHQQVELVLLREGQTIKVRVTLGVQSL
ncbi:MAG: S1C family serine protease [Fimbriimonadales bacterium]|nr:S1C family serine protease [Fimbriimonadales bacterium]